MGNLFSFPWTTQETQFNLLPYQVRDAAWGYAEATFRAENSWADINRMEVVAEITAIQAIMEDADNHENEIRSTDLYREVTWVLWDFESLLDETDAHIFTRKEVIKARLLRMTLERNYDPELTRANRRMLQIAAGEYYEEDDYTGLTFREWGEFDD